MKFFLLGLINHFHHRRLRRLGEQVGIDPTVRLLRGFSVRFFAPLAPRRYLEIGQRGTVNATFIFESTEGQVLVGNRCYIGVGTTVICRERVTIGHDVTMAWGVTIYDHNSHSLDWRQRAKVADHFYRHYGKPSCFETLDWSEVKSGAISIGDRAWLGFDVVVLKGVTIGEGAIVGARSVVTKDVEPYTVVAGNPAVLVRRLAREDQGC